MQKMWGWLNVTHLQFYSNVFTRGLYTPMSLLRANLKKKVWLLIGHFYKKCKYHCKILHRLRLIFWSFCKQLQQQYQQQRRTGSLSISASRCSTDTNFKNSNLEGKMWQILMMSESHPSPCLKETIIASQQFVHRSKTSQNVDILTSTLQLAAWIKEGILGTWTLMSCDGDFFPNNILGSEMIDQTNFLECFATDWKKKGSEILVAPQ